MQNVTCQMKEILKSGSDEEDIEVYRSYSFEAVMASISQLNY